MDSLASPHPGNSVQHGLDLRDVLDRAPVGRVQILVTALCALTYLIDVFDTSVIGALLPQIGKEFDLTRPAMGVLFSCALVGAICGYLFIAPLSAKFGQRVVMIGSVAAFGVLSLLAPFVQSYGEFATLRLLTGLFLGAALPGTIAMTGEFAPRRYRATFITLVGLGFAFGLILANMVTAALLEHGGWRMVMILCGAFPMVVVACLWRWLPESVFFLARNPANRDRVIDIIKRLAPTVRLHARARFHVRNPGRGSALELLSRRRWPGTVAIWVAYSMNLMVAFSFMSWLPTIFIDVHYSQRAALALSALTYSSLFVSSVISGLLMDRFGAFRVVATMFALAAVFVGLTGTVLTTAAPLVLAAAFAGTLFNSCGQTGMGGVCVFFYPPLLRATGYGWGSAIGRIGAALGPVAVGFAMTAHWRPQSLFYVASIPLLLSAIAIAFIHKHYRVPRIQLGVGQADVE